MEAGLSQGLNEDKNLIRALLNEVANIPKNLEFNIFKVLEIGEKEVIMCRFFRELLDPKGAHELGRLFLDLFFDTVLKTIEKPGEHSKIQVLTEKSIDDMRRIDIVIEYDDVSIPIEVKINAGDQKDQCSDYVKCAKNSPLYYLTINGDEPANDSYYDSVRDKVKLISWRDDISEWLKRSISQTFGADKNNPFLPALRQYEKAVLSFTHRENAVMGIIKSRPEYEKVGSIISFAHHSYKDVHTDAKYKDVIRIIQSSPDYVEAANRISEVLMFQEIKAMAVERVDEKLQKEHGFVPYQSSAGHHKTYYTNNEKVFLRLQYRSSESLILAVCSIVDNGKFKFAGLNGRWAFCDISDQNSFHSLFDDAYLSYCAEKIAAKRDEINKTAEEDSKMSFIGWTDQPATVDKFKIENYIVGLGKFITVCQTPITIAVQGDWGSGKTSVMNMVINRLDDRVLPVTFNAWQFSQFASEERLATSLITTIIDKIGAGDSKEGQEAKNGLNKFGGAAKLFGKGAAKAVANFVGENTIGSANTAALMDAVNGMVASMDTIATLKDNFQKCVTNALEKLNKDRILIFIDDLDRLQPIRAVELLEVLKNFLDCKKCVFVLAIDYNVVVNGVKSKYGVDIKENKGRSFFDKIIQVPFKMPVAQYDISGFVTETLNDIAKIKCEPRDTENFVALINSSQNSNPRSMKRLFNSYLLLLQVMETELKADDFQSKKTLFAILCMQQHLEHFYNFVALGLASANDDTINADFFNELATTENPYGFLMENDFVFQSSNADNFINEANQIQAFVKSFNRAISVNESDEINQDCMGRIGTLLKTSSVTATKAPASSARTNKSRIFEYGGQSYKSGSAKMNMGKLATTLIRDYAKEKNVSADDLMKLVNSKNLCGPSYRRANLTTICRRDHPSFALDEKLRDGYTNDPESTLCIDGDELLVYRWWPHENINKLIGLLGYENKVKKL